MSAPSVSVIVPVYNDPVGIRKVLTALIGQSYPSRDYEIVVADNGSSDSTPGIARDYQMQHPDRVRLVVEDTIRSSYAARNRGIQTARGETLAFTDADCLPQPTWIASGVKALLAHSARCGGGRITFVYRSTRPNVFEYFDSARKLDQKSYVERVGFAATANMFASKELFARLGPFRSDLISGGDYEFGRRVTKAGEGIVFIPGAVVQHPARCTFRAVGKKSIRVARGQRQLEKLGLLEHGRLSPRQLRISRYYVRHEQWADSLTSLEKVQLIFLQNLLNWLNYAVRVA